MRNYSTIKMSKKKKVKIVRMSMIQRVNRKTGNIPKDTK
jgi:hypothetical protein